MADPDRDLLFALIALRADLVSPPELLAAVAGRDPGSCPPLGDLLLGRGVLTGADVEAIERELAGPGSPTAESPGRRPRGRGPGGPLDAARPVRVEGGGLADDDPFATRASPPSTLAAGGAGWAGEPPNFGELAARARRFHQCGSWPGGARARSSSRTTPS